MSQYKILYCDSRLGTLGARLGVLGAQAGVGACRWACGARRRLGERALGCTVQAGRAQGVQATGGRWALGASAGDRRRRAKRAGRAAAGAAGARGACGLGVGRAASAHLGVLSWARLEFCAL